MALSIFTSGAAMSSTNALNKSNSILSTAMERLGTGKRINSAADDAAGLQIATRLQGQVNGMGVAQRNVADATAMLQTAEGAFDEVSNIMYRMKDLATQAASDTNSAEDREAMTAEMTELTAELTSIMDNTRFGQRELFGADGLEIALTFQIGSSADEQLTLDISGDLGTAKTAATTAYDIDSATAAATSITSLETALGDVGKVRSALGANINRLGHTSANLSNMKDNTTLALGNIRDADFATEATNMTRNQMLAQTSMSMLKQANSMSGMVMSLLG
ncbi:flagellin N-terminal helical domain-containing protein [Buttiauxella massiliensis]|uniref:flagellin N-terminal helical domain-containing protein n=1 Tax=Buttiauxella massiliensis TaxID=2831590 RepID=UPI00125F4356|nr:flagellin [Buttiauxella massiliensis]